jgi:hypothetical protein
MDDFHWLNFIRGFNEAIKRISDPNCLGGISRLAGDLSYSGRRVLKQIFANHGFSYGGASKYNASTSVSILSPSRSTISLYGNFFDGPSHISNRDMDKLDYGESLALTILHELVHALGAKDHGDAATEAGRKEVARWNDEIYDNCFAKDHK